MLLDVVPKRVAFLDNIRVLAIVMVVGIHAFGSAKLSPTDDPVASVIWFLIDTIPVAVFFLVDGFLFIQGACKNKQFSYKNYILKSSRRLLLPWLIFTIAYIILRLILETTGFISHRHVLGKSPSEILFSIWASSLLPHMYFLPSLFFIRLLSILNYRLVNATVFVVITTFISYVFLFKITHLKVLFDFILGTDNHMDPLLHAFWGLQYYLLGMLLFKLNDFIERFPLQLSLSMFVLLVIVKTTIPTASILIQYSFLIGVFCFFSGMAHQVSGWINSVGKNTMGIYLIHAFLLTPVSIIAIHIVDYKIAVFMLIWAFSFLLALGLTKTLSEMPYGYVLFGDTPKKILSTPELSDFKNYRQRL